MIMRQILKTKALYWLLLVFAMIIMTNCKKDDNISALLEGSWDMYAMYGAKGMLPMSVVASSTGISRFIITFYPNEIFTIQETATESGTISSETGTYTLSGKSLSITEPAGNVLHFNITTITQTQLVMVDNTDFSFEVIWYFTKVN